MGSRQSVFVGERFKNKAGEWFEVVEYITGKKIRVVFDKSGFETIVEGKQIRLGNLEDALTRYPQPGQRYEMKQNGVLEIVEYRDAEHVVVKFIDTGFVTTCEFCQVKRGTVKDLLLPRVCVVGYIGDGPHTGYKKGTHEPEWAYLKWSNMLERCYDPMNAQQAKDYKGVTVCKEWHNYQNFAQWAKQQVGYGNRDWAMEKDLLVKGNRFYAPDKCCFLPQELNNQMLKSQAARGNYPIGVSLNKPNGKFLAHCKQDGTTSTHIGIYNTIDEAFNAYKVAKESRLKLLANKWKSQIDPRAYEALMCYQVEITD